MIQLGELVMILDLHRQGLSVSAIARQSGLDRKTVRKYIATRPGGAGLRAAQAAADGDRSVRGLSCASG